jgi:hypothetical protein
LLNHGCKRNRFDLCLYIKQKGNDKIYILVHVDDLLITGSNERMISELMENVGKDFEITNLGGVTQYLGIQIYRDTDGKFEICQSNYIDKLLAESGMKEAKEAKTPLCKGYYKMEGKLLENNHEYRSLIGTLNYLGCHTRPDIAAAVSMLGKRNEKPRDVDLSEVKRVIRYLKGTKDLRLKLNDVEENKKFFAYCDANWGECMETRLSNTGYAVFVNGGIISWCSRRQGNISTSSTEAEYIALFETSQEMVFLRHLIRSFDINADEPSIIKCDNQSCIAIAKTEGINNNSKHFDIKYRKINERVEEGVHKLEYVATHENTADILTKPLDGTKVEYLRKKLGIIKCERTQGKLLTLGNVKSECESP